AIGPDLRAIHAAAAIEGVQQPDRAIRLGLRGLLVPLVRLDPPHHAVELPGPVQLLDVVLPFQVVAVQLADEESPSLIPAHARPLADERLTRDQIDAKPLGDLEAPDTLLGRKRFGGIVRLRELAADCARHSEPQEWNTQVPGVVHRVPSVESVPLTLSRPPYRTRRRPGTGAGRSGCRTDQCGHP